MNVHENTNTCPTFMLEIHMTCRVDRFADLDSNGVYNSIHNTVNA